MHFSKLVIAVASAASFFGGALAINGDATFYAPGLGACGQNNSANDLVAALNPGDYAAGAACGRRIRVTYQGRSVDVTAVDLCPGCGAGGIDLSPAAFNQLANPDLGRIRVDWNFI